MTNIQIDYVIFHLGQHISGISKLKKDFQFGDSKKVSTAAKRIFFPLSDKPLDLNNITIIADIPIIFPFSTKKVPYELTSEGTLIFNHDFLKSIFYLLSGYQEYFSDKKDFMERFPYEKSIQNKLGILTKPIVNYYFEYIVEGIMAFGKHHGIELKRIRLFDSYGFLLSHDIDRVDYYHWRETTYRFMQLAGLKKVHYPKKRLVKAAFSAIIPTFFSSKRDDPFWSFGKMRKMEKSHNMVSTWYFLIRDGSAHDARYRFSEKRIKDIMTLLYEEWV